MLKNATEARVKMGHRVLSCLAVIGAVADRALQVRQFDLSD